MEEVVKSPFGLVSGGLTLTFRVVLNYTDIAASVS